MVTALGWTLFGMFLWAMGQFVWAIVRGARKRDAASQTYEFTLVLDADSITSEMENAIYGSGCADATLACSEGVVRLTFARDAASLQAAIQSAIESIQSAGYRVRASGAVGSICH